MNRIVPCLAALLCAGVASSAALAKTTTTRVIRGNVAAVEPSVLRVKSPTGQESIVRVPDDVRVSVRAPATLDAIKTGNYVGVTASRQPYQRRKEWIGAADLSGVNAMRRAAAHRRRGSAQRQRRRAA